MASKNVEADVMDGAAAELRDWASLWGDLLYVDMALHARDGMPDDAAHVFARRGLWEAAVIAYGRTFNSGRRRLEIRELVDQLGPEAQQVHQEVIAWRNQHAAHRVDQERERVEVRVVIDAEAGEMTGVAVRVSPTTGPEEEGDLLRRFQEHVKRLRDTLWETHSQRLEDQILREQDAGQFLQIAKPPQPPQNVKFSIDLDPTGRA